ncbi:alanyl-tRNA synthetase [Ruminococcus sp. YE71]|uniref:alanyl-tRNA editing protein n=1 Tax=unclassified Ruminococcus TaxID=2608920 RepID=UPI0008902A12|nr:MULTISPECIES: alanine--tRNA ligase-related protein [unclassified Ruminococcus]SDA21281.1 alanyl-tRNA synthetase [Ruminococcus sp. YE78]SFW32822.1 alanyl-tRNA synthetase [Ruminococcus sp. YE71]
MTERLYDDGSLMEFDAKVVSCTEIKKGFEVVLDRTAFFPEGGGQQGDVGRIDGAEVIDTYEKNGEIIHKCKSALEVGSSVHGTVDEHIRLRRMQNHSGEHLLMGFIHAKLGYENVGFHLGSSEVTLDLNGTITDEDLKECELKANEAIARDLPITITYPDSSALASMEYRSKLEMTENVRIVTIEGVDVCACCAPHVSSTGKIGIVKVLSSESYKGGTRVHILCGLDAFELLGQRLEAVAEICRLLSAKPEKAVGFVEKLLGENNELKRRIAEAEKEKAAEIIASLKNDSRKSFCVFTKGIGRDALREVANKAVLLTDGIAGVFGEEEQGFSYIIASANVPLRAKSKEINSALGGKGGGSDQMIQGSVTADKETIEKFFSEL